MKKHTILIADDGPHIRRIVQFNLETAGFSVISADDGSKAFEILKKKNLNPSILKTVGTMSIIS
jgi:DNA-binding response OmpR family regulator